MQPQHIGGLRIDSSLEFSWTARRTSSNGIGWTLEDVTSRMTIDKQDRLETARQCSLSHDMGMSQHVCREITSKIYQNQNQNHIANFRRLSKTFEDFRRPSKTFEDLPAMAPIRGPELAKLFRGHVSLEIGDHGEVRPWRLRPAPRRNMEKPWRTTSWDRLFHVVSVAVLERTLCTSVQFSLIFWKRSTLL